MLAALFHPRWIEPRLLDALADSPVVLVHGPRQCGKTTLARHVGERQGYIYYTFDDGALRASAETDPVGFIDALPAKVVLDEVQRVPELFTAIKARVDRERRPGQFLLTGSTNVLLLPQLSDSLAGRIEILRLHPLARAEIAATPSSLFESLFSRRLPAVRGSRLGSELPELLTAGGFPAARARSAASRRAVWYRDYVETLVQRDVQDLARIHSVEALPRLLILAAGQTARLFNVSALAAPFQLSRPTIRDYITLLERLFLLELLPAWHSNRISRLVKTPKLHVTDTGLACALLGVDAEQLKQDRGLLGQILETFVCQELRRIASWEDTPPRFYHFRNKDRVEVDVVLEGRAGRIVGVEVKAAATVKEEDFAGLRKLERAAGDRFVYGVVFYDGEQSLPFGEGLAAVPIRALWEAPAG
ncbi:MAG TPA: ATP-binding protein [Candidatus Sumerlaeota bacterium]|nr:ATP-binding protein [Candidatus Sumerlaeota bacterium]